MKKRNVAGIVIVFVLIVLTVLCLYFGIRLIDKIPRWLYILEEQQKIMEKYLEFIR